MDSDSRYVSKEFNSFQVILHGYPPAVSQERQQRLFCAPFKRIISISLGLCSAPLYCCDFANVRPAAVLLPQTWKKGRRGDTWHPWVSVLVKSRVFLTCNWYYPRVGPPFPVAPATPSPASLSMRMLTKFRHLQSSGGGIRSQRATETLRRHDKSPPSTLALCFSPTLNVFSVSPQPRDQLVSTSNAFVLGASRSTRGVNETLCLWASRALRVPLVCQTQPSTLLW